MLFFSSYHKERNDTILCCYCCFCIYHTAFHTSKIRGHYPKRQVGVCLRYLHIKQGERQLRDTDSCLRSSTKSGHKGFMSNWRESFQRVGRFRWTGSVRETGRSRVCGYWTSSADQITEQTVAAVKSAQLLGHNLLTLEHREVCVCVCACVRACVRACVCVQREREEVMRPQPVLLSVILSQDLHSVSHCGCVVV